MSDHIPFEIQIEIMSWLPVKSLIRFGSVSKTFKSLIGSSKFIADYSKLQYSRRQHLLIISYQYPLYAKHNSFVSIVDDDTFPEHKRFLITSECREVLPYQTLIGSSHGLFCFVGHSRYNESAMLMAVAVIWNPSIRKTVTIRPKKGFQYSETLGFGVCPNTVDPKIVRFGKGSCKDNYNAEVFTLSSRMWRSISSSNILLSMHINISFIQSNVVVIDGFIYWLGYVTSGPFLIVSFDLTSEKLMEIHLPDELGLSCQRYHNLEIFKLRESLTVIRHEGKARDNVYEVWKMEINGVTRSFTKLFNIDILPELLVRNLCGFTKNGQLIVEAVHDSCDGELIVYEPCTKSIINLGINWSCYGSSESTPYTESLLLMLVDKPYTLIYT
ncbi:putative F-box protein At1g32420 [Rutidosis leptorrhynchoides]|uniref:putative F-box protein At1g32420 n=1 Tax=Rutidosis leptorrhynchoides TaxID=125765 RepID=UPI003A99C9AC